uniref:Endonuclease V N-glycosylase UV repair enzyme n=1 Tax=Rhizobium phage LG08 TaxID=3129229 RepID=A0AAU8HY62_9CAUD
MTRINVVPPSELHDKHLVAEYRELPRIFNLVRKAIERGEKPDDKRNPKFYTLGAGHVRFFYNKCAFLFSRQILLCIEMQRRGFKVNFWPDADTIKGIDIKWLGEWVPNAYDIKINRERIADRMPKGE